MMVGVQAEPSAGPNCWAHCFQPCGQGEWIKSEGCDLKSLGLKPKLQANKRPGSKLMYKRDETNSMAQSKTNMVLPNFSKHSLILHSDMSVSGEGEHNPAATRPSKCTVPHFRSESFNRFLRPRLQPPLKLQNRFLQLSSRPSTNHCTVFASFHAFWRVLFID